MTITRNRIQQINWKITIRFAATGSTINKFFTYILNNI